MIILVPDSALLEIAPMVAAKDLPVTLVPYTEDGPDPDELPRAEGVLRWIAGKRYARLVENGPKIRWLHTASAGLDHVITNEIRNKRGLVLTDSGDSFPDSIGEFVLAWMLAETHRIPEMLARKAERKWEWMVHGELAGQRAGIVGLGPIGRGIAARCRAIGMETIGYRRSPEICSDVDETVSGPGGLAHLLGASDWVILAAPLTDETRHLIGARELSLMKSTARLVNIARGPIVDEAALLHSLQAGGIAGAILDVFDTEPLPPESPFWRLENVRITCHSSGWTAGLRRRQRERFVENLARFAGNEPLLGIADIERGY